MFNPYLVKHERQWYRLFSHAFIHAHIPHLIFNMLVLYFFGDFVELLIEKRMNLNAIVGFSALYIGGILFSSVSGYARHHDNPNYFSLGASGAVSSVLYAFIIMAPTAPLNLFFIPIDIPAFVVGIGYLIYEAKRDKMGQDNIAHDAHFWGAVFGILFVIVLYPAAIPEFFVQVINYFSSLF